MLKLVCIIYIVEKYTVEDLKEAMGEVQAGRYTVSAASRKFAIPRQTLSNHMKGQDPHCLDRGGKPELTSEEEEALIGYITYMAAKNFPVTRDDVKKVVVVRSL